MTTAVRGRGHLTRFGWLSIGAALITMTLKVVAWRITGSVGLLSDALESTVNLVAAVLTLLALTLAARPPDESHEYGHEKAELFSAGAEGLMILVAGGLILWTAIDRLLHPQAVERIGLGLAVSTIAALVNLAVALVLLRTGRRHRSAALVADGHHLLTDVWTSAGVLVAVLLVGITGWNTLDPLVALVVGTNIVVTGILILGRSGRALMDPALPEDERRVVDDVLARHASTEVRFHAVRTRVAGHRRFVSMHVLVPGAWTVTRGHDLVELVEADLRQELRDVTVLTHLEPLEDPSSYLDLRLDREEPPDA